MLAPQLLPWPRSAPHSFNSRIATAAKVGVRCTFNSSCTVVGKSQKRFVIVYTTLRTSLCSFYVRKLNTISCILFSKENNNLR